MAAFIQRHNTEKSKTKIDGTVMRNANINGTNYKKIVIMISLWGLFASKSNSVNDDRFSRGKSALSKVLG